MQKPPTTPAEATRLNIEVARAKGQTWRIPHLLDVLARQEASA